VTKSVVVGFGKVRDKHSFGAVWSLHVVPGAATDGMSNPRGIMLPNVIEARA
jgi:hypothetical protein